MGQDTGRAESSADFRTCQQGGKRNKGAAGQRPAKPLTGEALTQEALLIDNDGVILRGLGQTEELAPGGQTDRHRTL